jgi:hypothetical protein
MMTSPPTVVVGAGKAARIANHPDDQDGIGLLVRTAGNMNLLDARMTAH